MSAHLYHAPAECPVCGDQLITTRKGCRGCGTEIAGEFASCEFCALSRDDLGLLRVFLGSRGNLREVEKHLQVSYPTARARLDAVLREEKGYTYGMRSSFRPRIGSGLFVTSGSVRADTTVEALGDALDILEAAREGFTPAETRSGIDFLSQTAPGRYATADAVADEAVARALERPAGRVGRRARRHRNGARRRPVHLFRAGRRLPHAGRRRRPACAPVADGRRSARDRA